MPLETDPLADACPPVGLRQMWSLLDVDADEDDESMGDGVDDFLFKGDKRSLLGSFSVSTSKFLGGLIFLGVNEIE